MCFVIFFPAAKWAKHDSIGNTNRFYLPSPWSKNHPVISAHFQLGWHSLIMNKPKKGPKMRLIMKVMSYNYMKSTRLFFKYMLNFIKKWVFQVFASCGVAQLNPVNMSCVRAHNLLKVALNSFERPAPLFPFPFEVQIFFSLTQWLKSH